MKLAILQMSDTPQIESTAVMLRAAGYYVKVCGNDLRGKLKRIGCDTVLAVEQMIRLGYDELEDGIEEATLDDMHECDLFVEIKIRNVPKILSNWPNLQNKILYWRVNGAQPEICPKGGDEVNLPCPIVTACLWYGTERYRFIPGESSNAQAQSDLEHERKQSVSYEELLSISDNAKLGANGGAYTFWPPFPRSKEYDDIDRGSVVLTEYDDPFCVCHNVGAWGYGDIIEDCRKLGVRMFGNGSPAGQISHRDVPGVAAKSKALVHLKSVDCPGWALYEAILAGCPVITGRLLNSRMLAYDLLENGVTCIEFGVPATLEYGRGPVEMSKCMHDIQNALEYLSDPEENKRIGEAGRQRLNELMWNVDENGEEFNSFLKQWIEN